jgi:hypothetical protein
MPFNSTDFTKAPWAAGVMTLTHEECVHVLTECQVIRDNYDPATNNYQPITDDYVQVEYNRIDWTKGINGDTYAVLVGYDLEVNTLGINEYGIIYPEIDEEGNEEVAPETPIEEVQETPETPAE